ncbi:hypothetical protein TNCV_4071851 [Trichonephila clavipes]|uniref:Uncharacterized protein n=1 Tax=Trichonephila clavipes TaxID=2585209 RepID=A0A8X6W7R0_TRICX|nr:hypothetical protein TNCV_4071851 [Trichonephila clavipes]
MPDHKTSPVKQYLVKAFGIQIIGNGGVEDWSPRSPDLTPLDFFLCLGIHPDNGTPESSTVGNEFCDQTVMVRCIYFSKSPSSSALQATSQEKSSLQIACSSIIVLIRLSPSQYGGYDPRLVTESVRIPTTDLVILNHSQVKTHELADPSPNFYTAPMGGRLSLDRLNVHRPPLQGRSSAALGSNS